MYLAYLVVDSHILGMHIKQDVIIVFIIYRFSNVRRKIIDRSKVKCDFGSENTYLNIDDAAQNLTGKLLKHFKTKPDYLKNRSNSISLYQTCIMMMTITAISAVDFKIFPSRFRKSKTFGLSLVCISTMYLLY